MEHILTYFLLFALGASWMYIYFKNKLYNSLKEKKVEVTKEEYDKLSINKDNEINSLNNDLEEIEKERDDLLLTVQDLELSLGLVDQYEYGVLSNNSITQTDDDGGTTSLILSCGFKVIQKGANNVRISINKNDIKSSSILGDKAKDDIIELLNGWYDIDDVNITWIEPDEARKRDMKIDSILNQ